MRIVFFLIIISILSGCNSKREDQGDYEFYDSDSADSIFNNKILLSKMPGRFVSGVKNRKGKPFRYLMFTKADTAITIGKNFLPISPNVINRKVAPADTMYYPLPNELFYSEYSVRNFFLRVVHIHRDTTDTMVRESQLLAAMNPNSRDTILYQEEVFYITKGNWNVVGGTFAVFDNKNTLKEMKEICDNNKRTLNSK